MTDQRILVTGAAGFIGSHIVDRLLDAGHEVWGLDNFDAYYPRSVKESNLADALPQSAFHLVEGDLRDEMLLAALFEAGVFQAVIHLAARAGVRPSIQVPDEYYDCNVIGTLRLLEAMRRFGVERMVFASSSSVYGDDGGDEPFTETDVADRPLSPYAATKRACELLCHTYWHLHGIRSYCLRLFTVYGPRQRPDLAIHKFARRLLTASPIPIYGDGTAERDFTYIDDVADGILRALERVSAEESGFEILNIGASRTVSVLQLVEILADAMDAAPTLEHLPPQPGDVPRTWADITRARDLLGYDPKVTIEEGLRRFAAWIWAQQDVGFAAERGIA